jgi:hypothetical protein
METVGYSEERSFDFVPRPRKPREGQERAGLRSG